MHFELLIIFLVSFVDSQTTERNDVLCVNKQCKLRYREWVIKCAGGILNARFVADFMGLQFLFPLAGFSDTYVMRAKVPTTHTNWNRLIRVPRSSTIQWMQEQVPLIRTKRKAPTKVEWNDPLYPKMWYLTRSSEGKGHDMKVQEAWKLGYTGKNVVVTIMDDGVDHTHPDLITNYVSTAQQIQCSSAGLSQFFKLIALFQQLFSR
ncbi:Furin [Fasciola gigantica]|uniref:Furin n=1 Tax=Fasciola gigantica TaxID=46835 RepID=A0A504YIE5_FASGI|nr:Furin [Fasciola gigantica]